MQLTTVCTMKRMRCALLRNGGVKYHSRTATLRKRQPGGDSCPSRQQLSARPSAPADGRGAIYFFPRASWSAHFTSAELSRACLAARKRASRFHKWRQCEFRPGSFGRKSRSSQPEVPTPSPAAVIANATPFASASSSRTIRQVVVAFRLRLEADSQRLCRFFRSRLITPLHHRCYRSLGQHRVTADNSNLFHRSVGPYYGLQLYCSG